MKYTESDFKTGNAGYYAIPESVVIHCLANQQKAIEWDKVVLNADYIDQTENAIRELRHDNIWLKKDLKSMKEAFALANNWRNAHLDDAKLLDKIREFHDKSDWTNMWKET